MLRTIALQRHHVITACIAVFGDISKHSESSVILKMFLIIIPTMVSLAVCINR